MSDVSDLNKTSFVVLNSGCIVTVTISLQFRDELPTYKDQEKLVALSWKKSLEVFSVMKISECLSHRNFPSLKLTYPLKIGRVPKGK